ncbi:ribosome biogenesis protein bop1-B isoform X2 [Nematostella vectensis]|uniref:ribosome biogenesis protein bop1-B isoform X2 n=1 Tax=Nematostella vectensis TaxID=45351 RepID=UPI0020770791|nr:ribosome biogenesis protein bop1-B isoform X2 [Nematostella vectensis]
MPKRALEPAKSLARQLLENSSDLFLPEDNKNRAEEGDNDEDDTDSEESEYSGLDDDDDDDDSSEVDDLPESDDSHGEEDDDDVEEDEDNIDEDDDDDANKDSKENNIEHDKNDDQKKNMERGKKPSKVNTPNIIKDNKLREAEKDVDDTETSDEEDARNTVGNIPVEWYNEYPHIGYDLTGKKIMKPATGDELDDFLSKMDNPDYWRTVRDKATMREVVLTDEELAIIDRIQNAQFPESGFDPYEPYVDFFTNMKMIHPVSEPPEPKSRFIPSKWEHKRVMKIVRAIRNGWIKPKKTEGDKPRYYMLWDKADDAPKQRHTMHIPAPKMKLPGHDESYNPPPEYLPTQEEIDAWEAMDPEDRPRNFLPKKYSSLRLVPAYNKFIQERFERCLDLYLCPRQRKMRVQINPEELLPKLPKPKDLQPFPTTEALVYEGHSGMVRCVTVDPTGQWLATGSDDKSVKFWEVATGRCTKTVTVDSSIQSIDWNPNPQCSLVAVAMGDSALVVNPWLGDKLICSATDEMLDSFSTQGDSRESAVEWGASDAEEYKQGIRLILKHIKAISKITWHAKGDYFATLLPQGGNKSVFIHQLSKRRSQCPFKKAKGLVQQVLFHPSKPFLFVATQKYVRVYNLMKQELTKKLISNVKWISSMAIHPKGDNLIVGSYDRRLCWFDMDLSSKPYKTLRSHKKALRQVAFHKRYPLFASASDDGTVIISHGMVYNDLMQNPLLVPVKILRGHKVTNDLGVLDCVFHPSQPWIFTAGSDQCVRLFT